MRKFWILAIAVCAMATTLATAYAYAIGFDRAALWQVVRACVADYQLTGAPYPCLEVNLSGGEERGEERKQSTAHRQGSWGGQNPRNILFSTQRLGNP